jgi:chloramphenicol 3-O phosphotransferase
VGVEAIVLNGGSSSGKSTLARCLQEFLGPSWLILGVDDLIRALPSGDKPLGAQPSIDFVADGSISVSDDFRRSEAAWYEGLAAIARCETGLIIDEVFLGGAASQERLAQGLSDLTVLWVGVRCDPEVAAARERGRHDRIVGMARLQAERVHEGVIYDFVVDTTDASAEECALAVIAHLTGPKA